MPLKNDAVGSISTGCSSGGENTMNTAGDVGRYEKRHRRQRLGEGAVEDVTIGIVVLQYPCVERKFVRRN